MRINEFRRVGYPSYLRESRFRFFGTERSFEQLATTSLWQDKRGVEDVSALLTTRATLSQDDPMLKDVAPALRNAFVSGHAPVHDEDTQRLPSTFEHAPNGHAWVAARFTLPGLVAQESARRGGERLPVPDLGEPPSELSGPDYSSGPARVA
jgi:hypothetical protein